MGGTAAIAITEQMKEKGLRITPQRFAVYQNLLQREDHPTVEQILEAINQELPIASKASVYSALKTLQKVGLIREVLLQAGVTRYDAKVIPHHHFVCESCGAIADMGWQTLETLSMEQLPIPGRAHGYEVTVRGQCDRCLGPAGEKTV